MCRQEAASESTSYPGVFRVAFDLPEEAGNLSLLVQPKGGRVTLSAVVLYRKESALRSGTHLQTKTPASHRLAIVSFSATGRQATRLPLAARSLTSRPLDVTQDKQPDGRRTCKLTF